jgi:hypothetical protein
MWAGAVPVVRSARTGGEQPVQFTSAKVVQKHFDDLMESIGLQVG